MEGMVAHGGLTEKRMKLDNINRIIVLGGCHSHWPHKGGAVVAVTGNELSMGLNSDENEFWLRLEAEHDCLI